MNTFNVPRYPSLIHTEHGTGDIALHLKDIATQSKNIVLVTDPGLVACGIAKRVEGVLATAGYTVHLFADLKSDPLETSIDSAARLMRSVKDPLVIGLGGGSSLDVAKFAAAVAASDFHADHYEGCRHPFAERVVKTVMIPTTAGTGSEVTRTAIYTNKLGRKVWAWGDELLADRVILVPELTLELPISLTVATGLDALVHAIEACTSRRANHFYNGFSLQAIRLVKKYLPLLVSKPDALEARSAMLTASMLAGIAIDGCGTGIAHAMGHALGTLAGVHHGKAVSLSLLAAFSWNEECSRTAFADVSAAFGDKSLPASQQYQKLLEVCSFPNDLYRLKLQIDEVVTVAMSEENMPMINNNVRQVSKSDLRMAVEKLLKP